MTATRVRGPAVVDTDGFSSLLVPGSALALRFQPLLVARSVFISFQTEAEIRFGAELRGWGRARLLRMESTLSSA